MRNSLSSFGEIIVFNASNLKNAEESTQEQLLKRKMTSKNKMLFTSKWPFMAVFSKTRDCLGGAASP